MKCKWFITGIAGACLLASVPAAAQNGKLFGLSYFGVETMAQFSQSNTAAFGTARSSAMGGAFTSLGGDLASIAINPAGLGMYRSSEFGFSIALNASSLQQNCPDPGFRNFDNNRTRFGFNNVAYAMNLYQGSGALTSFTFAVGYNKIADFNQRSTIFLPNNFENSTEAPSIGTVWAQQLQGISANTLGNGDNTYYNYAPSLWSAIAGYDAYMIDSDGTDRYALTSVDPQSDIDHQLRSISTGSIGEYSFSGGFNFDNRIYFGLGIGLQDIYLNQEEYYGETYYNNPVGGLGDPNYRNYLSYMDYSQRMKFSGSAVNLKIGVIARPIDPLRIGLSFQTPSWMVLRSEYGAEVYTKFNGKDPVDGQDSYFGSTILSTPEYRFSTPPRLSAGLSYTFGEMGVLSADYERVWYTGMRLNNASVERENFKTGAKEIFQGTNNVRVGGEFKPVPAWALRAGFAYAGMPMRDWDKGNGTIVKGKNVTFDLPLAQDSYNVSGGAGYRFPGGSIDLSYVYMHTNYSSYDLFYYEDSNFSVAQSNHNITPVKNNHLVTLSLAFRF